MAITITKFAEERILDMMQRNNLDPEKTCLRIGLRSGGCSGYSYLFEFTDDYSDSDRMLEFEKIKICVDKKSFLFLNGMEVDYEETPFKSGIKLNNPAVKRMCGCGESVAF